jgi:hypothetical protein
MRRLINKIRKPDGLLPLQSALRAARPDKLIALVEQEALE